MTIGIKIAEGFDLNQLFIGYSNSRRPKDYDCLQRFRRYDRAPQDHLVSYQESGLDRSGYAALIRSAVEGGWGCSYLVMADSLAAASSSLPPPEVIESRGLEEVLPPTKAGLVMSYTGLGLLGAGLLLMGGGAAFHRRVAGPKLLGLAIAALLAGILLVPVIRLIDHLSSPN